MKSLADNLPPEIAAQIHPDWRKNEANYWAVRDRLLSQFQGQWIGFADGAVIVSGTSAVEVLHAAQCSGRHPFVICVGREHEPTRFRGEKVWPSGGGQEILSLIEEVKAGRAIDLNSLG